ncbi:hypothetical protein D1AOALGA4SA_12239 [Olavius algarvensis Delta 1 endosymbiont]|nr:hypothetical protein D1AOALGA4SA_12239 [Olavius algarvensis Delta 1 endosymbiont]
MRKLVDNRHNIQAAAADCQYVEFCHSKLPYPHIYKDPVVFGLMLYHHEEHEDHEGKTEHMAIPSSCPSCPSWW